MKAPNRERQQVMSFRVTKAARRQIEKLAALLTLRRSRRYSLTDVIEELRKDLK